MKAKQPDFYNKHFGHFGDDAAITKQGRLTLNYVCDVANDLKAGNDAAGIGKVENVSDTRSSFYKGQAIMDDIKNVGNFS